MLSLRGVEVDVLRKMIATTNKSLQLPSSAQMEISLINGPTSHVVSGAPQLLTELLLDLMEQSAGKKFKNYYCCCGCRFLIFLLSSSLFNFCFHWFLHTYFFSIYLKTTFKHFLLT